MNVPSKYIVAALAVLSIVGALLVFPPAGPKPKAKDVLILRAARPLAPGSVLGAADLAESPVRADWLPAGDKPSETVLAEDLDKVLGRTVTRDLVAGQPLQWGYLAGGRMAPPSVGFQPVTLQVQTMPQLFVGSFVNLFTILPGPEGRIRTVPIVENVRLRSLDENSRTIEVDVAIRDAEPLRRFSQSGRKILAAACNPAAPARMSGFNPELLPGASAQPQTNRDNPGPE